VECKNNDFNATLIVIINAILIVADFIWLIVMNSIWLTNDYFDFFFSFIH